MPDPEQEAAAGGEQEAAAGGEQEAAVQGGTGSQTPAMRIFWRLAAEDAVKLQGPGSPWWCVVMAWRYIKMAMCGTVAARRQEEEDLHAAATVSCMDFGRKRRWGGSVPGHEVKKRKRDEINEQIMRNYFNDPPLYGDALFRRSADALDDTYAMGETIVIDTLFEFVETVIDLYEKEYLRPRRARELEVILNQNEARGFLGMIGSIDCMHWQWENCPSSWAGSHNDINVLQRSPVFDEFASGRTLEVEYWVNGNSYTMGYYLADKIYPNWATFVKTVSAPASMKHKIFASIQDSYERDIYQNPEDTQGFEGADGPPVSENRDVPAIDKLIDTYNCIKSKETSTQLQ
ncbi:hypothetical protein U9M48_027598 [Paspalum notatum var. saurae]|uniref:Uncharacterized protein n=1 Tax=Paspalum notatum var. saurae TaxID=547442 RepID=A0AAQ3TV19_PASNO